MYGQIQAVNEKNNSQNAENQPSRKFQKRWFLIILGASILVLWVFRLSRAFGEASARYSFEAQSFLNILLLIAIVVQAFIYYEQWTAMTGQSDLMRESLIETRKSADAAKRRDRAADPSPTEQK